MNVGLPGLAGRRVLVTGGSRGNGRATVRWLAASGASVGVGCHQTEDGAARVIDEARSLLSDAARHITGEILNVNGGSVLCG